MNKFFALIPRYLIKNKKRTFLIALSITLSVALINSVYIMADTLIDKFHKSAIESGGGIYHGSGMMLFNNELSASELIESKGRYIPVGTEDFSAYKVGVELGGYEEETYNLLNMKPIEGTYPQNEGEVAIEKWIKDKVFSDKKIGDKITLKVQEPVYDLVNDRVAEYIDHENTFTLVGVLSDSGNHRMDTRGRAAIPMKEARRLKSVDAGCTFYFRVKDEPNAEEKIQELKKENPFVQFMGNEKYIEAINLAKTIEKLGLFLIITVSIGAIAVIYNIFYITVIERIREFSMLRAVGASKGHIIRLILGEAICLGIVCIPIGIAIGVFGIKGIYLAISKIGSETLNPIITSKNIMISAGIGLGAIIISALTPAIFGGKVNPIEGMKENYVTKVQSEPSKDSVIDRIVKRTTGFTGLMAYNNMKKSKRRLLATIISLTISITLFVATTYLLSIFNPEKQAKKATGGDIYMNVSTFDGLREGYAYNEEDIDKIINTEGVKEVKKHRSNSVVIGLDQSKVTQEGKVYISDLITKYDWKSRINKGIWDIETELIGAEKNEIEAMKPYLREGSLDLDENGDVLEVILVDNLGYTDYINIQEGDETTLVTAYQDTQNGEWKKIENVRVKVKAVLKSIPIRPVDYLRPFIMITNNKAMEKHLGIKDYEHININVERNANMGEIKNSLEPITESKNGGRITTYIEEMKNGQNTILVASLILYGFAGILAIIAVINIVNTMSISVILRRREFGTLRAVGMSKGEVTSIILKEGVIYGVISSIVGCILGGGISHIIYKKLRYILLENELYELPWATFIGVTIGTIVITTVVCIPAIKRALNDSIVESIKIVE
ncbi:MAG: FtsX-like permease family protein [Clostridium sp.]|uniref:ABC transporter permease n=1 Tax=Clostridium sp. TaxID=1506 RepID=UPI0030718EC9